MNITTHPDIDAGQFHAFYITIIDNGAIHPDKAAARCIDNADITYHPGIVDIERDAGAIADINAVDTIKINKRPFKSTAVHPEIADAIPIEDITLYITFYTNVVYWNVGSYITLTEFTAGDMNIIFFVG